MNDVIYGDLFKSEPIIIGFYDYGDFETFAGSDDSMLSICDSCVTIMNQTEIDKWKIHFDNTYSNEHYDEGFSFSCYFPIENNLFLVISSGSITDAASILECFCNENEIECQPIVDTMDFRYVSEWSEIYTGQSYDNEYLLKKLLEVYKNV